MHGVAFDAKLRPVRVIALPVSVSDLQDPILPGIDPIFATGWRFLVERGVPIINVSMELSLEEKPVSSWTKEEVERLAPLFIDMLPQLVDAGTLAVIAAGNASLPEVGLLPGLPHLFPELSPGTTGWPWQPSLCRMATGTLSWRPTPTNAVPTPRNGAWRPQAATVSGQTPRFPPRYLGRRPRPRESPVGSTPSWPTTTTTYA